MRLKIHVEKSGEQNKERAKERLMVDTDPANRDSNCNVRIRFKTASNFNKMLRSYSCGGTLCSAAEPFQRETVTMSNMPTMATEAL